MIRQQSVTIFNFSQVVQLLKWILSYHPCRRKISPNTLKVTTWWKKSLMVSSQTMITIKETQELWKDQASILGVLSHNSMVNMIMDSVFHISSLQTSHTISNLQEFHLRQKPQKKSTIKKENFPQHTLKDPKYLIQASTMFQE